jgi:CRISPR-associated protein Csd1
MARVTSLNPEALEGNKPLSGEYFLGYYCQRQKLLEKKDDATPEDDNDTTNSQ